MDLKSIQALYEFNRWANTRVLDAASKVSLEKFLKDLGNSFSSIRDTLAHILTAEWAWVERWNGRSPKSPLNPADFPDVAALRRRWAQVEREQAKFISTLTVEGLEAVASYVNLKGETWAYPLWQQLVHVINHSTYHRGQITTMLRQVRAEATATDLLIFYDEKSRR